LTGFFDEIAALGTLETGKSCAGLFLHRTRNILAQALLNQYITGEPPEAAGSKPHTRKQAGLARTLTENGPAE
jgi:hypothetical protein